MQRAQTDGDLLAAHMQLGDTRRDRRCGLILDGLLSSPAGRVTEVFEEASDRLATYRFLESDYFSGDDVISGVARATADRIKDLRPPRLLVVLDKSGIALPQAHVDLNPVQHQWGVGGFWSLNAVVIQPGTHCPIGLLAQLLFERPDPPVSHTMTEVERRARPWKEKESYLWRVAIERCMATLEEEMERPPQVTFIIDAEGDIADLLAWVDSLENAELLIRVATKSRKEVFLEERIDKVLDDQIMEASYHLYLPRQKRTAHVGVGFAPLSYNHYQVQPSNWRKRVGTIHTWGVIIKELEAPSEAEPVEWLLVTSYPVENIDESIVSARHYNGRWLIERVHHGLKQVLELQQTQLRSRLALKKWIHLQTEAAVQLERLMRRSRSEPDVVALDPVNS